MDLDLTGKVALVTGGGSGIGAACVRELANLGASIVVVDRDRQDAVAAAGELGDRAIAVVADVADPQDCLDMVGAAVGHFGGLDIAVNSAGIGAPDLAPTGEASWELWRQVISVNLDGVAMTA